MFSSQAHSGMFDIQVAIKSLHFEWPLLELKYPTLEPTLFVKGQKNNEVELLLLFDTNIINETVKFSLQNKGLLMPPTF